MLYSHVYSLLAETVLELIIKSNNTERNGQMADYYQLIYNCLIALLKLQCIGVTIDNIDCI